MNQITGLRKPMDKRIEQELTYKEWEKEKNILFAFLRNKFKNLLIVKK